jgi:hypothetical protein
LPKEVAPLLAQAASGLLREEFATGRGPDGQAWEPVVGSGESPLSRGPLATGLKAQASAFGFEIEADVPWAGTHQYGATISAKNGKYLKFKVGNRWVQKKQVVIPRRQFVPEEDAGPVWTPVMERKVDELLERMLGGES